MNWVTLEKVWLQAGSKTLVKVRFDDWNHRIKYFEIVAESEDGKRLVGILDNGEKISYAKKSRGWSLYHPEDEYGARAI